MKAAYELCYRRGPNDKWTVYQGWDFADEFDSDVAIERLKKKMPDCEVTVIANMGEDVR